VPDLECATEDMLAKDKFPFVDEGTNLNKEDINSAMDTTDFVNNIISGKPTLADQGSSADTLIVSLAEGLEPRDGQMDPQAGLREVL
jgi:hypothetical protein